MCIRDRLRAAESRGILLVEAEQEVFGYTHADVGGILLDGWHIPEHVVEGVRMHHLAGGAPETQEDGACLRVPHRQAPTRLASAVHAGDVFVRALLMGSGGDNRIPRLSHAAMEKLGISPETVPATLKTVSEKMSRIQGFLEIL